jgi:primary-amine oxidase
MVMHAPHPLAPLTVEETNHARDIVLASSPEDVVQFRMIYRQEPEKAQLVPFLDLEHAGALTSTSPRPPRLACVHYVRAHKSRDKKADEVEAIVDLGKREVVSKKVIGTMFLAGLSTYVVLCTS